MALPSDSRTWTLDTTTSAKFQDASGTYYKSEYYRMHNLIWSINFYPNFRKSGHAQSIIWLDCCPSNIGNIIVSRELQLSESNTTCDSVKSFTPKRLCHGWGQILKTNDIPNVTALTFTLKLHLLEVYSKDGKNITQDYVSKFLSTDNEQEIKKICEDDMTKYYLRLNGITEQMKQMTNEMVLIQNALKDVQSKINCNKKMILLIYKSKLMK